HTHLQRAVSELSRFATEDVLFSPTGQTLVTGEITTGQVFPPPEVIVNRSPVSGKELAQSAPLPGRLVGFVDQGHQPPLTDPEQGSVLPHAPTPRRAGPFRSGGSAAAVSPNGKLAACAESNGAFGLRDLSTGK